MNSTRYKEKFDTRASEWIGDMAVWHLENDPDNKPEGDSAWFVVYADDIDALEKMYYTFKFRFAPEEE